MPLIDPGKTAPAFTLMDQIGCPHSLSDYRGRIVVLYFYPEDDTPLCTAQACQFRDAYARFGSAQAAVLGISPDPIESHEAFSKKFKLPFPILSDPPRKNGSPKVCSAYGAWGEKNMYGRIVTSMLRTTYLIDPRGRVAHRWDRVKTPRHGEAVLKEARALHERESASGRRA